MKAPPPVARRRRGGWNSLGEIAVFPGVFAAAVGTGTLVLTNANTYTGATAVNEGTLVGTGSSTLRPHR